MYTGKQIVKYPFNIHDDSSSAHEDNFKITWDLNNITIIVSGSEQEDIFYRLSFDGSVEL